VSITFHGEDELWFYCFLTENVKLDESEFVCLDEGILPPEKAPPPGGEVPFHAVLEVREPRPYGGPGDPWGPYWPRGEI
jgi:hypothetical protein